MAQLFDSIASDISLSLKKGDAVRVETLRFLLSAVRNEAIAKYGAESETKVTDSDVLDVVKKQVKTHKESVETFEKAGRTELADKEKAQLTVLEAFLPKQMTDSELKELIAPVASSGETNFGLLMKQAMEKVGSRADGGRVAQILKQLL